MIEFTVQETSSPVYKLYIFDDKEEIGFYLLLPQAFDIFEVHTHFYPQAYGSAVEISKQALKFVFSTFIALNILVTKVPISNVLAKRLTIKCGLKPYGLLPKSFKSKFGIYEDQELFYILREDLLCQ